jgi:preprotein translocase subunit SecY
MILNHIRSIFSVRDLRKKIIATLILVLVYKLLTVIPVPWVNTQGLQAVMESQKGLAFFSALMGWGLASFSIVLMGLSPYINATIIIQLLGVIVPKIGDLQKEGEAGQKKISKITRFLTLPLAFLQSYWMIYLLNNLVSGTPIMDVTNTSVLLTAMLVITAGTMFLVWLGEIISEYGIGSGTSIIIMAWVLAAVPGHIMGYISSNQYPLLFGLLIATLVIIYVIIKFTEGNRRLPIIYTRTGREEKSYFPIRVNQAGMVPIIFAISLVTFPAILGQIFVNTTNTNLQMVWKFMMEHFSMQNPSWVFIAVYFFLVLGFSFFYVSVTFNTENIAESIQKKWWYVPWIRPGTDTSDYLTKVSSHLNLFWGWFLALIAVMPYVISKVSGQTIDFIISASGLIIIVSVILDLIRKVDAEMKMFDYSKYK